MNENKTILVFLISQFTYFLVVTLYFISIQFYAISWLYLFFVFFIEPLALSIIILLIFKPTIEMIFILAGIKAIFGVAIGVVENIYFNTFNLRLLLPGLIVALYFLIISLIVYAIQHFESKYIENVKNELVINKS